MEKILAPVLAGVIFAVLLPEFTWYALGVLLSVVLVSFCYISIRSRKNRSFASSGSNSIALLAIWVVCGICALSIIVTKIVLFLVN